MNRDIVIPRRFAGPIFSFLHCHAGVDSSLVQTNQTQDTSSIGGFSPVVIPSQPVGALLLINGDHVGTITMMMKFAVS